MFEKQFMEGVRSAWNMPATVESGTKRDGKVVDSIPSAASMAYIGLSDKVPP